MRLLFRLFSLFLGLAPGTLLPQANLAGRWSLNVSGDLAWPTTHDLASYYPNGAIADPAVTLFPGFSLTLRRHLDAGFFTGFQLGSLPKGYSLDVGPNHDTWTLDALTANAVLGWMVLPTPELGLFLEVQAGWFGLSNGALERSGPGSTDGVLEGSGLNAQAGVGLQAFILPSVALEAQGGWRNARVGVDLSTSAGKQTPPSGPEFFVDDSGPFVRLGLTFYWGLRNPWGEQAAPPAPKIPPPPGD
jgi:hypothetical protein